MRKIFNELEKRGYQRIYPIQLLDMKREIAPFDSPEIIRFQSIDGGMKVLPFDSTVSVLNELDSNFYDGDRFFAVVECYTNDFKRGKIQRLKTLTVENLSDDEVASDVEVLETIYEMMTLFGIEDYVIEISTADIMKSLLNDLDAPQLEIDGITSSLATRSRPMLETALANTDISNAQVMKKLFDLHGDMKYIEKTLENLEVDVKIKRNIQSYLDIAKKCSKALGEKISFDFCMDSDTKYYSSIRFKVLGTKRNSVLLRGGRYDEFAQRWNRLQGIGYTFYLDELEKLMPGDLRGEIR